MRRILAWLPLPLALLSRWLGGKFPGTVEKLFSKGLYPFLAAPLSRLAGVVSFPIVEPLAVLVALFLLILLFRRRIKRVLLVSGFLAALFIGFWGLNYDRLPLEQTLSLPMQESTLAELVSLCDSLVADVNERHQYQSESANLLAGADAALRAASEQGWPIPGGQYAAPKYAFISPLLSEWMIEGITSPFTLEALVNNRIPRFSQPFVACHEGAHLRGFAREDDANLIAYLACEASDNPYYRYSGSLSMLLNALSALRSADYEAYMTCYAQLRPEVVEDITAHAAYWQAYQDKPAAKVSAQMNDQYLQVMTGGTQSARSYGRVVDLLLALERKEALYE